MTYEPGRSRYRPGAPRAVNAIDNFWQAAADVSFHTADAPKSLAMMLKEFRRVCPRVSDAEMAEATKRLTHMFGLT